MDRKEEQQMEIESLLSIYPEELTGKIKHLSLL